ncbi:hypothetical protein C9374_003046 [Naegleria lovaniensis]|uniref:Guanine nucleotide-binding protein subunit beta-like protein n=1 Tax=Naegleria lovaniensis TaxID=51637 RepID=A0AA88GNG0_NAELO|nr:uncharacterized protein C9374_003046 [Naegleria lovaniensis]KAG2385897.1 hypothetical protein C9374_003046 [Naegleria lovaniensis]
MKQIGLIPSGAQLWYKRIITVTHGRLIYCSTIAIYVYNLNDFRLERILTGHSMAITGVVASPHTPHLIATSSLDQTLRVWDITDGKTVKVVDLKSIQFKPYCIEWSHTDRYQLIIGSKKGALKVWDFNDDSNFAVSVFNGDDVRMIGLNSRNPGMLFVNCGAEFFLVDVIKRKTVHKYRLSDYKIVDFQWDPLSTNYLICCYENGQSVLYDTEAKEAENMKIKSFDKSGAGISSVSWIRNEPGNFITSDIRAGVIRYWNVSQTTVLKVQQIRKNSGFQDLVMLPGSPKIACAFKDGAVGLYDISKKQFDFITPGSHTETIFDCDYCPANPDIFATSGFDHSIRLWDTHRMKVVENLTHDSGVIYGLAWHPTKKEIAGAFNTGLVIIWDAQKRIPKLQTEIHKDCIYRISWNPIDHSLLATSSKDTYCNVFSDEGKITKKYKHPAPVFGVCWHPKNKNILATGCHDFIVRVFNINNSGEQPVSVLKGHTAEVFNVVWHPTINNVLASGSNDKTIRVWDNDNGSSKVLRGHTHYVRALAWNHELSNVLLSGSWDGTIRVWDASKEKQLAISNDHHADVYGISSHPERPFIFGSTSRDTTIRFWDLEPLVRKYYVRTIQDQSLANIMGVPSNPFDDNAPEMLLSGHGSKTVNANMVQARTDVEKYTILSEFFNFPYTTRNLWELANSYSQGKKYKSSLKSDVLFCNTITDTVYSKAKELESSRYKNKSSNASQRAAEQLRESAKQYLKIGKMKNYCEIMCEIGEWEKAIAVAPSVSLDYWRDLTARYAKTLSENENEEVMPYYIATGEIDKLLNFCIRKNQLTDASIIARRDSEEGYPKPAMLPPLKQDSTKDDENHDNAPITIEMRRIAELQAKNFMKEAKPIMAASAFLSIRDIDKCLHFLVKGCEGILAYSLYRSLLMRNPNDSVYLSFANSCTQCGQWDIAAEVLAKVKNRAEAAKLLSKMDPFHPLRENLFIKAGFQPPSFYSTQAPAVEHKNPADCIRFYSFASENQNAALVAIVQYEELFAMDDWNWPLITEIHSAVQCIDATKLESLMKTKIMMYTNMIGAQLALWKEYYNIAPKLAQNARDCMKKLTDFFTPKEYIEYLYCLCMAYGDPEEGVGILGQALSREVDVMDEKYAKPLILIKKRLEDRTFLGDVPLSNLVVPSGSNLPVRSLDGKKIVSMISKKEAQPPVMLEDHSVISLAEADMWREVNTFSPTMTGVKI